MSDQKPQEYRVELCGNMRVYHPVKPTPRPKEEASK